MGGPAALLKVQAPFWGNEALEGMLKLRNENLFQGDGVAIEFQAAELLVFDLIFDLEFYVPDKLLIVLADPGAVINDGESIDFASLLLLDLAFKGHRAALIEVRGLHAEADRGGFVEDEVKPCGHIGVSGARELLNLDRL